MSQEAPLEIRKSLEKAVATVAFWGCHSPPNAQARPERVGRAGRAELLVAVGLVRALFMAAQPSPSVPLTRRPLLLGQAEGSQDAVTMAAIVPKEEGLISVSEDR